MPELLRMPEVAANTTEAVLLSWPIAENVPYSRHDTIATVETAKAVVDVEAESEGVILRTLVAEGTEVAVGEPIALIAQVTEVVPDVDVALAALGHTPDAKGMTALEIPEADPMPSSPVSNGTSSGAPAIPRQGRIFASPLARRLAREAGLTVATLTGTGPNHRIIRRDVEAAILRRGTTTAGPESPAAIDAGQSAAGHAASAAGFVDQPHSRQRRMIAARLTHSKQTAPHFYLRGTARVDKLLALRAELNDGSELRVSVNDLVVKAVAHAHLKVPALNVTWSDEALRQYQAVDVAVAVATPSGLVTPVVRSVQSRTITEISASTRAFAAQARSGQLRQHDLDGGSITVTNLGMYGVEEFMAIINPPQAAILAVGAAREEPQVRKGKLRPTTMMHLTLSVDHRAVDGAQAAEWMGVLVAVLERPVRIIA